MSNNTEDGNSGPPGLAEYKRFIDELVEVSAGYGHGNVSARWVRSGKWHNHPESVPSGLEFNKLLGELSVWQREMVARLLEEEYVGAIHNVLAYLTDKGYRLIKNDVELAREPFGTENYFDFIARRAGDQWPDDRYPDWWSKPENG